MNATFVAEEPLNGRMAFCSQSGAIGAAVLNSLRETDIKFSQFISVGNKADVNENDLLRLLGKLIKMLACLLITLKALKMEKNSLIILLMERYPSRL